MFVRKIITGKEKIKHQGRMTKENMNNGFNNKHSKTNFISILDTPSL